MKVRNFVSVILALSLVMTLFAGCSSTAGKEPSSTNSAPASATPAPVETPAASEPPAGSEKPEVSAEPVAPAESEAPVAAVDFNGTYKCIVKGPMGEQNVDLVVTTDADGNVTGSYNNNELTSGTLTGNQFELKTEMMNPALGSTEVALSGTVDGDSVSGDIVTVVSTSTFTGTRG